MPWEVAVQASCLNHRLGVGGWGAAALWGCALLLLLWLFTVPAVKLSSTRVGICISCCSLCTPRPYIKVMPLPPSSMRRVAMECVGASLPTEESQDPASTIWCRKHRGTKVSPDMRSRGSFSYGRKGAWRAEAAAAAAAEVPAAAAAEDAPAEASSMSSPSKERCGRWPEALAAWPWAEAPCGMWE